MNRGMGRAIHPLFGAYYAVDARGVLQIYLYAPSNAVTPAPLAAGGSTKQEIPENNCCWPLHAGSTNAAANRPCCRGL